MGVRPSNGVRDGGRGPGRDKEESTGVNVGRLCLGATEGVVHRRKRSSDVVIILCVDTPHLFSHCSFYVPGSSSILTSVHPDPGRSDTLSFRSFTDLLLPS